MTKTPPAYEHPPPWKAPSTRWKNPNYNGDLTKYVTRTVVLNKAGTNQPLGFNIRGGPACECGVYISKVLPESNADSLGLKRGDNIISVNGVGFRDIDHSEAVRILKESSHLTIKVQHFPYGENAFFH